MTQIIERNDPLFFEQTCDKPYDRHHYKIVCETKSIVVESWEEVQEYWWNHKDINSPVIEVLDKKTKGFK